MNYQTKYAAVSDASSLPSDWRTLLNAPLSNPRTGTLINTLVTLPVTPSYVKSRGWHWNIAASLNQTALGGIANTEASTPLHGTQIRALSADS